MVENNWTLSTIFQNDAVVETTMNRPSMMTMNCTQHGVFCFGKKERGLDYTPLFRFLLSKIGSNWDEVFSEAKSRLDKSDPIFWIVALNKAEKKDYIRIGESSYFSGLYVDDNGILQITNPNLKASDMKPFCSCCTHTFNGKIFGTE